MRGSGTQQICSYCQITIEHHFFISYKVYFIDNALLYPISREKDSRLFVRYADLLCHKELHQFGVELMEHNIATGLKVASSNTSNGIVSFVYFEIGA